MKKFINQNFLLNNKIAKKLYHDYAKNMPIIDYHCHLNAKEIAENKKFNNITEVWLSGDHYKWRAMRSNGVDEKYITGNADDKAKFMKWAETIPHCIGNPLYHWTHLELQRYFNIDLLLSPSTAEAIWNECNKKLQEDGFSARGFIKKSNVEMICTTDDPIDTLDYHRAIENDDDFDVKVLPTFRPDNCINIEKKSFIDYIDKMSLVSGILIIGIDSLKQAIKSRVEFFHSIGCRLSDHALDPPVFQIANDKEIEDILTKRLNGEELSTNEINKFKTTILLFLGKLYGELGWVMQLHVGCIRDKNKSMLERLGPNTGYDAIGDYNFIEELSQLLDQLDGENCLPKTILYSLNPRDNETLAALSMCFTESGIPSKIQLGSAWWFNDHIEGMKKQMTTLASIGLLSRFVGMLTDSRSFLSYTRHEYFRRILCNLIGEWVDNEVAPNDIDLLGQMVCDISYNNANSYFENQ